MPSCFRIHGLVLLFFVCVQCHYTYTLGNIQKSVFIFQKPNVTNVQLNIYNNIPFEDCQCSVVSIEPCLTKEELKYARILPLILFLLEIYLFKYVRSLHQNPRYFLVTLYWIVSIFLFFCLLIIIY